MMIYVISTIEPYHYLQHLLSAYNSTMDEYTFHEFIAQFARNSVHAYNDNQSCVDYNSHLENSLLFYLNDEDIHKYSHYLYTIYWSGVLTILGRTIKSGDELAVVDVVGGSLLIEVKARVSELDRYIEEVCRTVESKLYEGSYVDPVLQKLYDIKNKHL